MATAAGRRSRVPGVVHRARPTRRRWKGVRGSCCGGRGARGPRSRRENGRRSFSKSWWLPSSKYQGVALLRRSVVSESFAAGDPRPWSRPAASSPLRRPVADGGRRRTFGPALGPRRARRTHRTERVSRAGAPAGWGARIQSGRSSHRAHRGSRLTRDGPSAGPYSEVLRAFEAGRAAAGEGGGHDPSSGPSAAAVASGAGAPAPPPDPPSSPAASVKNPGPAPSAPD